MHIIGLWLGKKNHESGSEYLNDQVLREEFTQLKWAEEYEWLYETSNNAAKQAIKDACLVFTRFFKKQACFPRFKTKRRTTPSFYNDNIKLTKKLRRLQRKVSRKYEMNKKGKEYVKTGNIIRLEKQIRLIHRKIANTRLNHIHQTTTALVKIKPVRIVMENLNVKGMMRNRHLSKAIREQGFNLFWVILAYKCAFYGVEIIKADKADRFYAYTKTCCNCGYVKKI